MADYASSLNFDNDTICSFVYPDVHIFQTRIYPNSAQILGEIEVNTAFAGFPFFSSFSPARFLGKSNVFSRRSSGFGIVSRLKEIIPSPLGGEGIVSLPPPNAREIRTGF